MAEAHTERVRKLRELVVLATAAVNVVTELSALAKDAGVWFPTDSPLGSLQLAKDAAIRAELEAEKDERTAILAEQAAEQQARAQAIHDAEVKRIEDLKAAGEALSA
jgi:hypothetical protein